MDKLNAISVFCKVVETQSFTQAAAQENISVAMASKIGGTPQNPFITTHYTKNCANRSRLNLLSALSADFA